MSKIPLIICQIDQNKFDVANRPLLLYHRDSITGAKRHLENADMPLYEIARICGFGSYINFYICFRQMEYCSPEVWRREHR